MKIKNLKNKLIEYFKKPSFDVTLSQLMEDFRLSLQDFGYLGYCVDESVKDVWITKFISINQKKGRGPNEMKPVILTQDYNIFTILIYLSFYLNQLKL